MRKPSAILTFVLTTFCPIFIGCAGKPITEMREARDAIRSAKEAGAERYAPEPFSAAQSSFNEAEEGTAMLNELQELYARAVMQAKIAEAKARQAEAEETLRQLQADLTKAKEAATEAKHRAEAATRELGQPVP
jgi:hypothetical protein